MQVPEPDEPLDHPERRDTAVAIDAHRHRLAIVDLFEDEVVDQSL